MTVLHIDTDLGVDDALALFVAQRLPGVRIAALSTVFGNVMLDVATRNARLMRHLLPLAPGLPILSGASGPSGPGPAPDAVAVHGADGLGGATAGLDAGLLSAMAQPAPGDGALAERIAAGPPDLAPGEAVILVGLGPATNLPALAAWYGPALSRIVVLSGAFFDCGNITPDAEFNAACDPEALAATVRLGVDLTFVPLDLCRKVLLARETIEQWPVLVPSPATAFLTEAHAHYLRVYREHEGIDGCFPHDTVAVLAACRPEPFFAVQGSVVVDSRGRTRLREAGVGRARVLMGGDLGWVRRGFGRLWG